ncbi:nucleotidyltransferase domain-containing protein [Candidatus Poribacteria bacterium]|nr:nucleotidyltransferase domain-containing protein [Candidatus Poribacteria bacterium]
MDKDTVINIVRRFRKALESKSIKVNRIVLFGSYGTGNQREESDIDVVVISDDFRDKGYWDRIDVLSSAIYEVFEPIEAVALTTDEWEQGDKAIVEFARSGEVIE